ncbi:PRY domain containing protein, putative [Babesia bigemina]|uniref:PRY domain containing protein, putative n=1 Tax=Babesia bigemina TaxID=5866 RepID=A0A061D0Z7_BABBI|nr:PRY domain containing protein, putative [Babesia bigemina]CDR94491.1 PRY domain containing protein, putative [Babesia bigemina]|eukprot:XP_012766677.1 PRY domain containing protein, putative [Babesia bigemina]
MNELISMLYGAEEYPKQLNVRIHQHYVRVRKDHLTIEYNGKGRYCDPGSVQSELPAPKDCVLYYFEVNVVSSESPAKVVVGFSDGSYHLNRYPGNDPFSVGYRGENGHVSLGSGKWESYGSAYEQGDTVGCGINYLKQCYFFTRNGKYQGEAGRLHHCDNFPTVGLGQFGDHVTCNFVGPFKFDIANEYRRALASEQKEINAKHVDMESLDVLVYSYLLYSGHKRTLEAFSRERGAIAADSAAAATIEDCASTAADALQEEENTPEEEGSDDGSNDEIYAESIYITDEVFLRFESSLDVRHKLSNLVLSGRSFDALRLLHSAYVDVDKQSFYYCRLLTQHFLELVMNGRVEEAIRWFRGVYDFSVNKYPCFKKLLEETMEILCYKDVEAHAVRDYYGARRRLCVAREINDLAHGYDFWRNSLRVLVQFLTMGRRDLRVKRGYSGPTYSAAYICQPLETL